MSRITDNAKDGLMRSDFNQQPIMQELLEDRNKTVSGLYRRWNSISSEYRRNYDNIRWESDNG